MDRSSQLAVRMLSALPASTTATSSSSARRLASTACPLASSKASPLHRRCLHTSRATAATPVAHPTAPGPPPQPPQQSIEYPQDRLSRKRQQAALLRQAQSKPVNPSKPGSALQKRFWKDVKVVETHEGLQVHLDSRPVRTATRAVLNLPHSRRALAAAIALEWDQLVSAQQALKQHYIPLTSSSSRALDIEAADKAGNADIRTKIVEMCMQYLGTDTLLCWAPEHNMHEPTEAGKKSLREKQREVAEPIIAYLQTHIFPGVDIVPILGEDSIMPTPQPAVTQEIIKGWVTGLPAFELAALERAVLATKSLLIAARMVVEWSGEFAHLRKDGHEQRFDIEKAAEAASMEVLHQTEQWGEVEDTHDVDHADIRRQLGSVILMIG